MYLSHTTPAGTRDFGFCGLFRQAALFSRLYHKILGCFDGLIFTPNTTDVVLLNQFFERAVNTIISCNYIKKFTLLLQQSLLVSLTDRSMRAYNEHRFSKLRQLNCILNDSISYWQELSTTPAPNRCRPSAESMQFIKENTCICRRGVFRLHHTPFDFFETG